ncbi:MAG TPA: DMT family transporter [Microbacteriaceae bacterium]|nr:DMT family transporter [Microbacteriaceae bacterium]
MVAIVLALVSALGYGISDFYGALATRRLGAISATLASYSSGVLVLGLGVLIVPGAWSVETVTFGALAGVLVGAGFLSFYAAIARGPVAILAPMIAVVYATVPVCWVIARGEQLPALAWAGVALGVLAVLLLSVPAPGGAESDEERAAEDAAGQRRGPSIAALLMGLGAALGMGGASVALDYVPHDSGLTSALVETIVAVVLLSLVFAFVPRPGRGEVDSRALWIALGSGVLLAVGNGLFVLALQHGSLALVGVLVSLYPLATILLARFVLREHISRVQWLGIGLAIVAAVLMGLAK